MPNHNAGLKAILPLFLVIFIDAVGMGILFPILNPIYMDPTQGILSPGTSMEMRTFLYGLTLCVFPFFMFFAAPVLGEMSDQVGRKKVLLICLLGAFVSYFLSGLAVKISSVALLIVSRIVAGLAAGSQPIAQAAVIDVTPPEKKAQNLSLLMLPACLGFVAGPLLGSYLSQANLVSWFDLSTPLYFAALFSLFNAVLLILWFQETFAHVHKLSLKLHRGIEIFVSAFKSRSIRELAVVYFCLQLGWSCYFQFVSLFLLRKYHYSSNEIGYFMALLGVGFALGLGVVIRIVTRYFSSYNITFYSFVISAIAAFITVVPNQVTYTWVAALFLAVAIAVAYVVILALFSNLAGEDSQGWVMGVSSAVLAVAWAVMGLVSGLLEELGNAVPMYTAAIFISLAAILLFAYRKKIAT